MEASEEQTQIKTNLNVSLGDLTVEGYAANSRCLHWTEAHQAAVTQHQVPK